MNLLSASLEFYDAAVKNIVKYQPLAAVFAPGVIFARSKIKLEEESSMREGRMRWLFLYFT